MPEHAIGREEEDRFRDGLLWIGGTYKVIECGAKQNCAAIDVMKPKKLSAIRGQARCFVHEAAWRGISRKVPEVPRWAVPGTTRIFLAHRGGATAPDRGKIFGYFVLHRIEVLGQADAALAPPDVQQKLPWGGPAGNEDRTERGELTVTVYDALTGRPLRGAEVLAREEGTETPIAAKPDDLGYWLQLPARDHRLSVSMAGYQVTELPGISVPAGRRRKVPVFLEPAADAWRVVEGKKGDERKERCPDGSEIVTHRFDGERWRRTRNRCPEPPEPSPCDEGAVEWGVCPDGTEIPVRICAGGEWRDTGVRCPARGRPSGGSGKGPGPTPEPTPIDVELLAPHRSCSLRSRPGAVYLVDALCAKVNESFGDALRREGVLEEYRSAESDAKRWDKVREGRKRFVEIANGVSGTWKTGRVAGKVPAQYRGDLVLFDRRVSFIRRPRAAFRGLARIDGEDLLDLIAKGAREPRIEYYAPPAARKPDLSEPSLTRRQIISRLAGGEHASLAAVGHFLDALAEVARDELDPKGSGVVRLPRIGTLRSVDSRQSVPPATRDQLEKELVKRLPTYAVKAGAQAGKDKKTQVRKPVLDRAAVHRLLDDLAKLTAAELHAGRPLRIERIGTLRRRGDRLRFTPFGSLGAGAVTFVPRPELTAG